MKQTTDKKTPDLLPDYDLAGERPRQPTKEEKNLARVKAWRAANGFRAVTLNLPADLVDAIDAAATKRGKSRAVLLENLIRTQLLRKR